MGSLSCESAGSFLNLSGDETRKPACVQMAAMVSQGGGEGTCLLWKPWLSFSGNWEHRAPGSPAFQPSLIPAVSHSARCDPGW